MWQATIPIDTVTFEHCHAPVPIRGNTEPKVEVEAKAKSKVRNAKIKQTIKANAKIKQTIKANAKVKQTNMQTINTTNQRPQPATTNSNEK